MTMAMSCDDDVDDDADYDDDDDDDEDDNTDEADKPKSLLISVPKFRDKSVKLRRSSGVIKRKCGVINFPTKHGTE